MTTYPMSGVCNCSECDRVYLERKKAGEEEKDDCDEHDDDLAPGADDGGALRGGRRRGDLLLQRGIITRILTIAPRTKRLTDQRACVCQKNCQLSQNH